jgi:glyoxylase I family protein
MAANVSAMAIVSSSGYAHVRLTVTDIARSKAFYDDVFGWPVAVDASDRVDEPGVTQSQADFYGGIIYETPSGALFGLRPVARHGDRFDSERTGLDHVSFLVRSRRDLVSAAERLTVAGIEHGEVTDLKGAGIAILSFDDPDGVHCELTAPL